MRIGIKICTVYTPHPHPPDNGYSSTLDPFLGRGGTGAALQWVPADRGAAPGLSPAESYSPNPAVTSTFTLQEPPASAGSGRYHGTTRRLRRVGTRLSWEEGAPGLRSAWSRPHRLPAARAQLATGPQCRGLAGAPARPDRPPPQPRKGAQIWLMAVLSLGKV